MKKRNGKKGIVVILLILIISGMIFAMAPVKAESSADLDISKEGSVAVAINKDEWYVEGSTFDLYYVASLDRDVKFTNTSKFNGIKVDLQPVDGNNKETSSKWMNAAGELIKYVNENGIQPDQTKQMISRSCKFENLKVGLYLIQGRTAKQGNRTVSYQPMLICVPQREVNTDPWKYDIEAVVKSADPAYESTPASTSTPVPVITPVPVATPVPEAHSHFPFPSANTSDTTNLSLYGGMLLGSAVVIAVSLIVIRKSRKKKDEG